MERIQIVNESHTLSDIANSLTQQLRMRHGRAAVVACNQPLVLMSLVQKAWLQLTRQLQRERANASDEVRVQQLTQEIAWMQAQQLSASTDPETLELLEADVIFATVAQLLRYAPECQAMYITCPVTTEQLHPVTAWMHRNGTVVLYQ